MKIFFLALLCCVIHSEAFFGFNILYPEYSRVSSECLKASSSLVNLPPKIEQILKISSKFSSNEYETFSQSLLDLRFFFNGLYVFLQQYSEFINEPPSSNPLKVITLLQYSAQLMESAANQNLQISKNFGRIFGGNLEDAMDLLMTRYLEQLTNIRSSLETLYINFESILESNNGITIEILDGEIDSQATAETLVAFQEISIASKQINAIVSGILVVLQSLESVSNKIIESSGAVESTLTLLKYSLNLEIKSAKLRFTDHIRQNIDQVIQSFGNYSQTSYKIFTNTTSQTFLTTLQDEQKALDDYASLVSEMLWQIQIAFSKRLQVYYDVLYKSFQTGQNSTITAEDELKNHLSLLIIQNGGANFKKCFNNESNELHQQVLSVITQMENDISHCFNDERTLSFQIEGLMSFIVEDVTLNIQGAFDSLCKCSVKGGSKILEMTKECIGKIVTDLTSETFKNDEEYLNFELDQASETLRESERRFESCMGDVRTNYEKAFERFRQASIACMVTNE